MAKRRRESDEAATSNAEIEVRNEHGETDGREDDLSRLVMYIWMNDISLSDHIVEIFCEEWVSQLDWQG